MPRLIIREMGRERVVEIDLDKVTIGRSKANVVPINDAKASRAHCAIQKTEQGWFVVDLGSSNGTLLNGKMVKKDLLALGDVIAIGGTEIHFERVIEEKPATKPMEESAYVAEVVEEPETPPPAPPQRPAAPGKLDSVHAGIGGARYSLRIVKGPNLGSTYPLGRDVFTMGRKGNNTLPLDDERVSGNHAQISREGSLWVLTDLGSTNGTIVAGRRVRREILEHGAAFTVGSCTFQFVDVEQHRPAEGPSVQSLEFAEPRGLPSDADFARIDVHRVMRKRGSNALLTFLYAVAVIFLVVGGVYFAFQVLGGLLGRRSTAAPEKSLITRNWSFEEDRPDSGMLTGWTAPGQGWSIDEKNAKTGKQSLKLDCSVNDEPDQMLKVDLDPITVTPEMQYEVRIQVRTNQARKAGVRVVWSDPVNSYFVQESYSELRGGEGGSWKALRWTFVPPEKATRMELSLCAFGNIGTASFDDAELYEKELEPEARESQTVALGAEMEVTVDPRGTWNLSRLGALSLWDAQVFLSDSDGRLDAFSRQALSSIQRRAAVSGDSMLYLGHIYEPHGATWIPVTQEIYIREDCVSVRYKLSGSFKGEGKLGITFSARPEILSASQVEVSSTGGVEFFKGDFEVQDAKEMVWGSGQNRISLSFPEGSADIAAKRTKHGVRVVLSRPIGLGKVAEFAIEFSEISRRQQDKLRELFDTLESLREQGELQKAKEMAERYRLSGVEQESAKKRLDRVIKEIEEEGDVLVKEAQYIFEDFKKTHHPEFLNNLAIVVERIGKAFPGGNRDHAAMTMLAAARRELAIQKDRQLEDKARKMLLKGDSYRELGMLGLSAVYYEYVRDNFPATEWEKDARAKLEQLEAQIRHEGRW